MQWLRDAVMAARKRKSVKAWRVVEGQHVVSTMRLVDNDPDRQQLLEEILEEHKPPLPEDAAGLHYLLATPFRYPPTRHRSRFRTLTDPGVLYAALEQRTAFAEMGYWRWRFVQDSAGLQAIPASAQTLFQLGARGVSVDLRDPLLARGEQQWTSPNDYSGTQQLGRVARECGLALIVYRSVRDPEHGACIAVLRAQAIHPRQPLAMETWYLTVTEQGTIWQRESERLVFLYH